MNFEIAKATGILSQDVNVRMIRYMAEEERTVADLGREYGLHPSEVVRILDKLVYVGAVTVSDGPEFKVHNTNSTFLEKLNDLLIKLS